MSKIWQDVMKHKVAVMLALLVLLAGAGGGFYYMKNNNAPLSQNVTVAVGRGDVQATISATGTISAVNTVEISSRVTGLITEVRVQENDKVKAGQVLLVLDDTTLQAQVAQYKAQLDNYTTTYERSNRLTSAGGQSVQQLDTDRTNWKVAQSTYNNYVAQLQYYVITSPIDGMVIGKPTPAGQTVAQGISSPQVIMYVADMSKMQIKVLVDETDIGRVKLGQTVSFTVDTYTDKTFTGKVTTISRSATTSSNVVYYPVYVDVDSSDGLLFPTMTARTTIHVGESKNVLIAPASAVKEEKGKKYVQVMSNGKIQNITVETGLSDDENVEIVSGLNAGDQVVLPGAAPSSTTNKQNQGPPPSI
ncbi:MAG: efflux RND transporter periplasmic adaptor subunit [Negativicutes bacterium]